MDRTEKIEVDTKVYKLWQNTCFRGVLYQKQKHEHEYVSPHFMHAYNYYYKLAKTADIFKRNFWIHKNICMNHWSLSTYNINVIQPKKEDLKILSNALLKSKNSMKSMPQ